MSIYSSIRTLAANHATFLGIPFRLAAAATAAFSAPRGTYSQHGEDVWFLDQLRNVRSSRAIYVDVGANHSSRISNTYLLYRSGHHGVVIEPNLELLRLHRWFRPHDIAIGVGCGARPSVSPFHVTSAPVLSSFSAPTHSALGGLRVVRVEYLPVLPLDAILASIDFDYVSLLSIDVEGLDADVLAGAASTLDRALLVCVEANGPEAERAIEDQLTARFEFVRRFGCNLVWRSRRATTLLNT